MEGAEKKKIGGGSFIASGIFTTLTPAMFYIILGDFFSLLKDCSLSYSTIDIGKGTIVNCSEMRLVAVISYIAVFIGIILIVWGLAKKIIDYKEKSDIENKKKIREVKIKPIIKEARPKVREIKIVKPKRKIKKQIRELRFERSGL